MRPGVKTAVQRLGANEGGRREEEKRSEVSDGEPVGLHNRKTGAAALERPASTAVVILTKPA